MAAPVGGAAQRIRRHSERSGAAAWLEPCDVPAEPVRGGRRWPRLWAAPRSESGDTVSEVASPPAEIPWRRLSVRMLAVHPVREVLRSWPVLLGVLFLGARSGAEGGLWGLIGVGYVVVLGLVRWFTTTYRVSTEQVQVRRGLLRRETLTVPRDRVRTVDITASPLHRVLGLAQVSVGTGRTDRRDNGLKLDALSVDEAARLRVELLARSPVAAQPVEDADVAGAVGPPQVPPPETVLTAWHSTWLRYAPLWLAATVVVLVFVVVVALFSTVAYVVAYWGFRLSRQPGGTLHIVRGLLTRRSITLEERRLRGVEISEPLLVRLAGGARGLAIATGLRVGRGAERGGSLLVPPAARAEVLRVAGEVLGDAQPVRAALVGHGPRARLRRHTRALLGTALVIGVVAGLWRLAHWPSWSVPVALLLLPVAVALAEDRFHSLGHALTGHTLVVRQGSLVRRRNMLVREGIIGWNLRQSLFQRRAG